MHGVAPFVVEYTLVLVTSWLKKIHPFVIIDWMMINHGELLLKMRVKDSLQVVNFDFDDGEEDAELIETIVAEVAESFIEAAFGCIVERALRYIMA